MKNLETLTEILTEWLNTIASSILPSAKISSTSQIGKIMNGFFGINLDNYSVWKELGFLMKPTVNSFISPMLNKYLSIIPEDKLKSTVLDYVDSMVTKAGESGYINVFGIQLGKDAFEDLKELVDKNMEE